MLSKNNIRELGRIYIWTVVLLFILILKPSCIVNASRFMRIPQSQSIVENDSVDFSCEATGEEGGLHYEWLHNGHQIAYDVRIHQIGSDLHITSVERDADGGDYVCIATSVASGARQASPPAKLTVIYLESASVQLLKSNHNELLIKCHVEGASGDGGLLEIEWYRDNVKLSSWKNVEMQQHRLHVRQPSADDEGLYRCVASNAAGRVMSKKGFLYRTDSSKCLPRLKKNQEIPEAYNKEVFLCRGKRGGSTALEQTLSPSPDGLRIIQGPDARLTIKEGESGSLSCLHELPADLVRQRVQLRWRKDGKLLRQVELGAPVGIVADSTKDALLREDGRLTVHKQNGSLSFTSIIASDAGHYLCQLQLEGHSVISSTSGILEVIEQLKFAPQPTSKNLELGVLGKVHCKAQGTPTPHVRWLTEQEGGVLPDHVDDINGTLIFRNVSAEHRGNYTCMAANSQGQINATVAINVVVAPKFTVPPEGPIETIEQGVVVIHCQAIGDPKPTIQWDKDLQYLSENNTDQQRFHFLENGTLEIRDVQMEDDGKYGCTIGNSAGLKREEVRLLVKGNGESYVTEESTGDGFLVTRAVLITMTVALAYIVLVVGLMLWCRYRRQARKARLNELSLKEGGAEQGDTTGGGSGKGTEHEPCLPDGVKSGKQRSNGHGKSRGIAGDAQKSDDTACSQQSRASKKSAHVYEQLALPRSGLSELIQIGSGMFGDVYVGKIKAALIGPESDKDADTEKHSSSENGSGGSGSGSGASTTLSTLNEKRRSKTSMDDIEEIKEEENQDSVSANGTDQQRLVLVKALNKVKDEQACQEFRRQLDMFRGISHKGVIRLYGLCREKDPHFMVLENTDWGDLKQFLLATAGKVNTATATNSPPPLTTSQVLAVAYQIARGMDAIYRARFTHRDLATRNCVISSEFIVKVSYPAMCKDKYSREYHKHRNTLLPVRWMAPECMQEDEYTTKSDIFAYGVVVWELFNQATKLPHEELSNEQVLQRAQTNQLEWVVAEGTPAALKDILLSCWATNPKERPSFSQLGAALTKAMQNADK